MLVFSLPSQFCDSDLVAITVGKKRQTVLKLSQMTDFSGVGNSRSKAVFRCEFWEVFPFVFLYGFNGYLILKVYSEIYCSRSCMGEVFSSTVFAILEVHTSPLDFEFS